ncbi:MAG: phytanoyl-CoA dioxygenase family protein [Cyanobacteria bacterium SBLK]|nr:phytanoyl-CoA dioxygenase family protein [Cyanobacteria bacterium SBLK]
MIETDNLVREITTGKGYVVIPDVLTREEAKEARSLVLHHTKLEREKGKVFHHENKERLCGLIYKGTIFEKIVQHPQVLAIIEKILGTDIILGGFSAHIIYQNATRMGNHVDYPYWAMPAPFPSQPILEVQTIWLVEDFTENNGAPLFAPDTQKLGTWPDVEKFDKIAQKITGKAGSVIISHGLCWHDTSENVTPTPRVSLLGNYTPSFIHPLEENLYDLNTDAIDRATPQLKKLLRHSLKTQEKPFFDIHNKHLYQSPVTS